MSNARNARRAVFAAALACLAAAPATAQDAAYKTPPVPVGAILAAPRLPRGIAAGPGGASAASASLAPDGEHLCVPELPALVPIAALAEPVEKLAGLEILPGLRANRVAIKQAPTGLLVVALRGGSPVRVTLPADARVVATAWSNDGRRLACATLAPGGAGLWLVDAATGAARRLEGAKLATILSARLEWSRDDRFLWCAVAPANPPAAPPPSRVPAGPQVRVGAGRAAGQRTARDVLRTADDQKRFTAFVTVQIARVSVETGAVAPVGPPVALRDWSLAPDERHLVVERFDGDPPLGFPFYLFPTRTEVWSAEGQSIATVGRAPLNERSAISSVAPLGPRAPRWSPDGATLWFFAWTDAPGADAAKAVRDTTLPQPGTDRLMRLDAPFAGAPVAVASRGDLQFDELAWIGDTGRMLLHAHYDPRRVERREWLDPLAPAARHVLVLRSTEGVYDDPGEPLARPAGHDARLWTTPDGRTLWLVGAGFRADGQRPFLDKLDLATGRATRVFESDAQHLESVQALLDPLGRAFVTTRESNREPRNFWLRHAGVGAGTPLTNFADPAPALTASQRFQFTFVRSDSVRLNAEAVLPASWTPGTPLPTVFWIYPNDYRSAAAASQNRRSPNRFPSQSSLNPEVLVTQGYCVVYPDIAVVGTNDHYVDEIARSAQAAVDECVRRGYTDRARIGVAGHSYGAFSTVNLLAHTDLFKAGLASDGAYNRTLTPFTFQAEERTLWQARETYLAMSPFLYADQVRAPLLIAHNLDDTNVGTNPIQGERLFEALNGMGKTVQLVQYPYEDHVPAAKESVFDYWARAIEWFDRYVKNGGAAPAGGARK